MGQAHEPRSGCPISATIEVFGDRWNLLVLRDIAFAGRRLQILVPQSGPEVPPFTSAAAAAG
jgi:DNA-binding HxlR family transcriptional regulator